MQLSRNLIRISTHFLNADTRDSNARRRTVREPLRDYRIPSSGRQDPASERRKARAVPLNKTSTHFYRPAAISARQTWRNPTVIAGDLRPTRAYRAQLHRDGWMTNASVDSHNPSLSRPQTERRSAHALLGRVNGLTFPWAHHAWGCEVTRRVSSTAVSTTVFFREVDIEPRGVMH